MRIINLLILCAIGSIKSGDFDDLLNVISDYTKKIFEKVKEEEKKDIQTMETLMAEKKEIPLRIIGCLPPQEQIRARMYNLSLIPDPVGPLSPEQQHYGRKAEEYKQKYINFIHRQN